MVLKISKQIVYNIMVIVFRCSTSLMCMKQDVYYNYNSRDIYHIGVYKYSYRWLDAELVG